MNIREIEEQLNIPRASVRYYEKEGLLSPQRGSNNYRIYTEAEVEALKKIRLLRQLDMPVETIRAVQEGKVSLSAALDRQKVLLAGEAARLDQARTVCEALLRDQVTYPALDPARYQEPIRALPAAPQPEDAPLPPGAEWAFSPWQRYWARRFDFALAGTLWTAVLALVFRFSLVTSSSTSVRVATTLLSWAAVLLLEPLLLRTWGFTPGKWLLGLTLRDREGGRLSYGDGLRRTWGVLAWGYGFQVPFYSLYRHWKCFRECEAQEPTNYDYELSTLYYSHVGDRWRGRAVLSLLLTLALIPLQVLAACQVLVPPNRGDLTPAAFTENFNYASRKLNYDIVVDEAGRELWTGSDCYISEDGGPTVHRENGKPVSDAPVYTLETDENGFVTAVDLERSKTGGGGGWAVLPLSEVRTAVLALLGTERGGYRLSASPLLKALNSESLDVLFRSGQAEAIDGDYTLRLTLERSGYMDALDSLGLLIHPSDFPEEELFFRFTARLEKGDG